MRINLEKLSRVVHGIWKLTMVVALLFSFILLLVAGVSSGRENVQNSIASANAQAKAPIIKSSTLIRRYAGYDHYGNFNNDSNRLLKDHWEIQHLVSHGDQRNSDACLIVVYKKQSN